MNNVNVLHLTGQSQIVLADRDKFVNCITKPVLYVHTVKF